MPLKILHIDKTCTGCGACVSSCSKNALKLSYDAYELPHSAVQYAYNRDTALYSNYRRLFISKKIIKDGFIPTMRHLYLMKMICLRVRHFEGNVLRFLRIKKE